MTYNYISTNSIFTINTTIKARDGWGKKQVFDFIVPAPDHHEEKAYCERHKQEYTKVSYTLPSGSKYSSRCGRCERLIRADDVIEERKKDGYPVFYSKQEMEEHFNKQKEEEIIKQQIKQQNKQNNKVI